MRAHGYGGWRDLTVVAILATISPVSRLCAQMPRDSITTMLVGRLETAELRIDYVPVVPRRDLPWGGPEGPRSPGRGEPVYLRTTLPILLGDSLIQAGRYQLLTVLDSDVATLVIVAADAPAGSEARRIPLTVVRLKRPIAGLSVWLRTQRHGEDSIRFVYRSAHGRDTYGVEVVPGTASTLVIQVGEWEMSVPAAAR